MVKSNSSSSTSSPNGRKRDEVSLLDENDDNGDDDDNDLNDGTAFSVTIICDARIRIRVNIVVENEGIIVFLLVRE